MRRRFFVPEMADEQITTKPMASQAQWRYLFASGKPFAHRWAKATPGGKGQRFRRLPIKKKSYTLDEFSAIALKEASDPVAVTIAAFHTPALSTLKATQIAPGVSRIHGDLCNVHGRWGSCRAAGYGGAAPPSKRVAPKKLPSAPKPKAGGKKGAAGKKGSAARKPIKTEAQREQERQQKRAAAQQQRAAERDQNKAKVLHDLGIPEDAAGALADLSQGLPIDDDGGLVKMGLADQGSDGSYRLTATGRAFLAAAESGDAGRARDALGRARDQQAGQEERAAAQAARKRTTEERHAAVETKRAEAARLRAERLAKQGRGGGGKGKKPALPAQPRPLAPRTSAPPRVVGGGSGSRSTQPPKPKAPALSQVLVDAAQALSDGRELDEQTINLLIRNGLARRSRDGELILTAAGQRATKKEAATTKGQSSEDRAMFAKMGKGGGSGGGKSGGGGLWAKDPETGKRTPPKETDDQRMDREQRDRALALRDKRDEVQRKMRLNTDPSQTQPLLDRWRELDDAVQNNRRSGHISEADAKPLRDNSSTARIPVPKVRNNNADKRRTALHQDAQKQRALAATYPKGSAGRAAAESRLREIGHKLNKIDDETIKSATTTKAKSFAVFKDASGAYRWIARTTTAYRDRDGEIISEQALEDDAERMTATGVYGPLRYWHVGQPDPFSVDQPWGPGLDIGDCDYSIVIGRTSIESGTFKSEAIGRAFAESFIDFELSPGFFHAPTEPDVRTGVFNHIRRFERSVVPTQHGRASNLFTGLTVKEHHMDQATYDKRVKAYLDFAREKGIPPEDAAAPIVALQQADKEASARQIAYKEEGGKGQDVIDFFRAFFTDEQPQQTTTKEEAETAGEVAPDASPAEPAPPDPVASLKAELDTLRAAIAALKEGSPAETEVETQADMGDMEATADEESADAGLTLSTDDLAAIGQMFGGVLQSALEPLVGALGITQKLDGHMGELKALMSGYVKQKEAGDTTRTDTIAALKATIDQQQAAITESQAKLSELLGDQPRAAGYRPSQAADNGAEQLLAAIKDGPDGAAPDNPFEDIIANMFPGLAQGGK